MHEKDHHLDIIETGDILGWDQPTDGRWFSFLNLVRLLTMSEFGHVSIAVRMPDGLYHVEAVMPRIRMVKVPPTASFYMVPVSRILKNKIPDVSASVSWFSDKIGLLYSTMDAIRAYLGLVVKDDDRWQCAEISHEYYKAQGLFIDVKSLTPANLLTAVVKQFNLPIHYVSSKHDL